MTKALHITTEGKLNFVTLSKDNSADEIRQIIGGWFDCVNNEEIGVVGYVHDEGLLIDLPANVVASLLFGQPLAGDCVVIGAYNEQGEYDGENHDIPSQLTGDTFRTIAEDLLANAGLVRLVTELVKTVDLTPKVVSMNDEQFDHYIKTGEIPNV